MKSRIVCFLYLIVCAYIYTGRGQVEKFNNYHFDNNGYYLYLPAIFIYQDLSQLAFQPVIDKQYEINDGAYYAMFDVNGHKVNKYAIGTAIFELPFFLVAHTYCVLTGGDTPADGYSTPYEYAFIYSTLLWSFLGLLVLRKFLLRNFEDNTTAIVLVCIGFGTNFFTYGAFSPGMSHNYSFFVFACLLYFTDKWYHSQDRKTFCLIGLALGFIFITRPVNLISIIIPLFWGVFNKETLLERVRTITSRYKDLLIAFICFMLIALIQLGYWKYITGHCIYYSYQDEEFSFSDSKIIKGLFSYKRGWFVYTPIAFISLLGLFATPKNYRLSIILFFATTIYVVFSWENWYYGGGFGARTLIETLPVLALPLAFLVNKILLQGNMIVKPATLLVLLFFVGLSMFQSYQFSYGLLSNLRMSKEYYWVIFGKLKVGPENDKYLLPEQEYYDEIRDWKNN